MCVHLEFRRCILYQRGLEEVENTLEASKGSAKEFKRFLAQINSTLAGRRSHASSAFKVDEI